MIVVEKYIARACVPDLQNSQRYERSHSRRPEQRGRSEPEVRQHPNGELGSWREKESPKSLGSFLLEASFLLGRLGDVNVRMLC